MSASAHTQRRLACPPAEDLDEVGGVRESGASPDLGRRNPIEERGLKHACGEIDAGSDQHRPEGLTGGRQRSMQSARGHVERPRNVSSVEACMPRCLRDAIEKCAGPNRLLGGSEDCAFRRWQIVRKKFLVPRPARRRETRRRLR
jgi:hypothetical protein